MKLKFAVGAFFALGFSAVSFANAGYSLEFVTDYRYGSGGRFDSGFATLVNTGTSSYTGKFGAYGVAATGDIVDQLTSITLNPGDSVELLMITNSGYAESSNLGGFGKNVGGPDKGIMLYAQGVASDNCGRTRVDYYAFDSNIHSGVPRVNPFGDTVDSYVLQGGDSMGRDTQDGFETTQADGHLSFSAKASCVPAPGAAISMLIGFVGLRRRNRK